MVAEGAPLLKSKTPCQADIPVERQKTEPPAGATSRPPEGPRRKSHAGLACDRTGARERPERLARVLIW